MERNPRHPLDVITNNNNLSMLEALIPFVDYPMKLPLALLIKANEILLIIRAFQSLDYLSQIGLHNPSKDPMDMLGSLTGMSPDLLKSMMYFAENMGNGVSPDILSSFMGKNGPPDWNTLFPNMPSPSVKEFSSSSSGNTSPGKEASLYESGNNTFDTHLQQILSEYDMMQAAQLKEEQERSSNHE